MIKLIALDLDGTLLTGEKKITEENKKAIKLAKENGIKVVLCTGRPIVSIVHLLEELDLMGDDDYAINFNGGLIQKTKYGEIVYETGHTVEDMKYCHEEVTKVGLPLVMIDTVRAYEPTPPKGRPSIYNTLPHPITFEQKNPEEFEEGHIFNKAVLCIAQDILDEGKITKRILRTLQLYEIKNIFIRSCSKTCFKRKWLKDVRRDSRNLTGRNGSMW